MRQNNLLVEKSYFDQKAFVCYRVILDEFGYLVIQWIRPTIVDERKNLVGCQATFKRTSLHESEHKR